MWLYRTYAFSAVRDEGSGIPCPTCFRQSLERHAEALRGTLRQPEREQRGDCGPLTPAEVGGIGGRQRVGDAEASESGECEGGEGGEAQRCDGLFGHVTLYTSDNILEGSTGCSPWEAGFVLAEFILSNPYEFQGNEMLLPHAHLKLALA